MSQIENTESNPISMKQILEDLKYDVIEKTTEKMNFSNGLDIEKIDKYIDTKIENVAKNLRLEFEKSMIVYRKEMTKNALIQNLMTWLAIFSMLIYAASKEYGVEIIKYLWQ